jgi:phosphatidylserine/phosphatidylglycerophosphate/cardiolipin synthase-like enzyme
MRKKLLLAIAFSLGIWAYVLTLAAVPRANTAAAPILDPEEGIMALFSPSGGCTDALVAEINKSTKTLDIQAYTFTSAPIAQAVTMAYDRGVKIRILLDKSQRTDRNSVAAFFHSHHLLVYIDDQHGIAHNKVVLIDGKVLMTGSFNFTKSSEERNAENLLIIKGRPKLVSAYQSNFDHHWSHSIPFGSPATPAKTRVE